MTMVRLTLSGTHCAPHLCTLYTFLISAPTKGHSDAGAGPSWAESRAIVQSPDQEPRSCSSGPASGLKDNLSDPMIHLELCQDISRAHATQREPQMKEIFLQGLATPGTKACLNLTTKSSLGKLSNKMLYLEFFYNYLQISS